MRAMADAAATPAPPPPSALTVLVADDEETVRTLLSLALPRFGILPLLAADGDEAIRVYQAHAAEVRVALLDVRMPGRDGPATLAALRALTPGLPCVFMTGHAGGYSTDDLRALGAAEVVVKPFQLDELVNLLRRLCAPAGGQDSSPKPAGPSA
jgi:CheY-like chemotaxis protein